MRYKNVIFDLDGTLLDSIDDIRDSANHTMERFALPPITREEAFARVGNGSGRLIELCLPGGREDPRYAAALDIYSAWYAGHCLIKTAPYDDVAELLAAIRAAGSQCAIVSNKPDVAVQSIYRRFFEGNVCVAVGEKPGVRRKPAPDSILAAMAELRAAPDESVYVGDTEVDIISAHNAGIPCISVLWGFRTKRELLEAGGCEFAVTPRELLERLT